MQNEEDAMMTAINHGQTRTGFANARPGASKVALVAISICIALSSVAAEPTITVSAQQRYPWNGLVDLRFTITGTSGRKYDTSFTAKDMVGNTNITMRTIRKSNGSTANVTKEQLLPGNYNWVWDAGSDLPKEWKCDRVMVTGTSTPSDTHTGVQLWAGGPYWAETNIGAEDPWDYGLYFWWGDTIGYRRKNNAWVASDGSSLSFSFDENHVPTLNKNVATLKSEGWITVEGTLAPGHDAAHAHWSGRWRMPTQQDLSNLNDKCDWTWTVMNGVNGYVVRGRGNYGNASIFLPAASDGVGTSLGSVGSNGYYWSSVPQSDSSYYSWCIHFYGNNHQVDSGYGYRGYGRPVRPVMNATTGE